MSSQFGLARLSNPLDEDGSCFAVLALSQECVVCREQRAGAMWALGPPYHAMVHKNCLPHFKLDGEYPHPHVISVMFKSSTHGRE